MRKIAFACLLTAAGFLLGAHAAYLESDYEPSAGKAEPPVDQTIRPRPEPVPDNPAAWLIRHVDVENAWNYGNLTIFPLTLRERGRAPDLRTFDEAFSRNWIAVREKDNAQVSAVEVRNDSEHHILLMAGEVITGGRQNRMIRSDILLQPRSGFVEIAVYCGEKERWSGRVEGFSSGGVVAHPELRKSVAAGAEQGAIWSQIDAQSERAKVSSPTHDYHQVYQDKEVSRQLDDYAAQFRRMPRAATVGAVAVWGNRIIGCDIFSDPDLFSREWGKLLRSYGFDVLYREKSASSLTATDVRRFLDRAVSARYNERNTPGAGRLFEISGAAEGAALIWNAETVHVSLFGETVRYTPPPPPPPRPWPPHPWPPHPAPMWER